MIGDLGSDNNRFQQVRNCISQNMVNECCRIVRNASRIGYSLNKTIREHEINIIVNIGVGIVLENI